MRRFVFSFLVVTCFFPAPRVQAQPTSQAQMLAEASKLVDWRTADPQEALLAAAAVDNIVQARRALKRGANINRASLIMGHTPLIAGVQKPSLNMMKFLIEQGADVNGRAALGRLNFPLRVSHHADDIAKISSDPDVQIKELLAYMQSVPQHWASFRSEGAGITPLMAAAATGSAQKVNYLLDKGAKVNLATASGETALMAAAYTGYLPSVEALLEAGAQVNATNYRGYSALSFAVLEGQTEVARTLLHRGADSSLKLDGYTLPQIAQGFRYGALEKMLSSHIKWQQSLQKKAATQPQPPVKPTAKPIAVTIVHSDGTVEVVR